MDRPSDTPLLTGFAALYRRIAAALIVFLSLRIGMWLYGVPLSEAYQALLVGEQIGLEPLILVAPRHALAADIESGILQLRYSVPGL